MKKKLLVCLFVGTSCMTTAQPVIKLYGFKQESTPGIIPSAHRNENGAKSKKAAAAITYFIFLSSKKNIVIKPLWVIIAGKDFLINKIGTPKTPILYDSGANGPKAIDLVLRAKDKIIQLTISESEGKLTQRSPTLSRFTATHQMVVIYRWRKRNYYAGTASIKILPPIANE